MTVYTPPENADETWVLENAQTCDDCLKLHKNEDLCSEDDGLVYCRACRPVLHALCDLHAEMEPWESQLDDTPDDWDLRGVYADWLEEQGEVAAGLARAMRFMADWKRRPLHDTVYVTYDWWFIGISENLDIPSFLYGEFIIDSASRTGQYNDYIEYPSRRSAEQALADVFSGPGGNELYEKACAEMRSAVK